MKKAMVVCAIGDQYQELYAHVAPSFVHYSEKHGWDLYVISEIPDWFSKEYSRPNWDFRLLCCAYRLYQPTLFLNYDLLAIMDPDMIINPTAPCLSEHYDRIPPEGFAAAQTVSFEDRQLFNAWNEYYYDDFLSHDEVVKLPLPKVHINSGLVLLKPSDTNRKWLDLLNLDSDLPDEQRLNLYMTQASMVHVLPTEWNVIYPYELVRRGYQLPWMADVRIVRRFWHWWYRRWLAGRLVRDLLRDAYVLHFASTDKRIMTWIDVRKLIA
jgi:hypothetical protein